MPFDALAALRNLKSPVNVTDALAPFDRPEGASMSAHEMGGLDAARNMGAEALGAGPAFHALSQALDRNRFAQTSENLAERDDLESGVPGQIALQKAGIHNQVGDVLGEGAARREMLPFATELHARNTSDILGRDELRYGYPAQVKANADLDSARIAAQGRVAAAGARDASLPMRGLIDAFTEFIGKNGRMPSPEDVAAMKALYSGVR